MKASKNNKMSSGKNPAEKKAEADALFDEGRLDEAIVEYKVLIAMTPGDACAHFGLCDAYHLKGDLDLALLEIGEAMRLKPDWPYYHNKMGKILESSGDRKAALAQFELAVRLKPDYEDALVNLGQLRRKRRALGHRAGASGAAPADKTE